MLLLISSLDEPESVCEPDCAFSFQALSNGKNRNAHGAAADRQPDFILTDSGKFGV